MWRGAQEYPVREALKILARTSLIMLWRRPIATPLDLFRPDGKTDTDASYRTVVLSLSRSGPALKR